MRKFLGILLFVSANLLAQTKGIVKDSLSGNPIPYVSVWVENENIGTTAEENGEFSINVSDKSKNLVFSALGFKKKIVKISESKMVNLSPSVIEIDEIFISNKALEEIEIGNYSKNSFGGVFANTGQENVHIWGKIVRSNNEIEKHPFLKKMEFHTKSSVENALVRLRFFSIDSNGNSTGDLIEKNILVQVKSGKNKNSINLSEYKIVIPKNGIIIGFEYLKLAQNSKKTKFSNKDKKEVQNRIQYEPRILGYKSDNNTTVILNTEGEILNKFEANSIIELALKLTLTN